MGIQDNSPNQGKDNSPNQCKDKCQVCKYFRDNPAYANCPECGGEFELAKALFTEFAVLARKVYYDNSKWVYDPKLDDPIYSKFVIYIGCTRDISGTYVVSADMTSDYNIPPHIVKYAFAEDKVVKIGNCRVMSTICPHINCDPKSLRAWCPDTKRSAAERMMCPVEVFNMAFRKYTVDALLGALEPPAVPIVEPTVELTIADTQIRKSWVNAGGWLETNYAGKYDYNIVNPDKENLYIMPIFKCKSKSVFGEFNQGTAHMVFSIRMIQKYAPNLIKIGLDKLFGLHINNIYVPQCECNCARWDTTGDFMCPATVIRNELIKATYKIRDDAFNK